MRIELLPPDIQRGLGLRTKPLRLAAAKAVLKALARTAGRVPSDVVRDAHLRVGRALPA